MTFAKLGGGDITVGGPKDNWTLLVVYRGKHCPRCKKYRSSWPFQTALRRGLIWVSFWMA